MEYIGTQQLGGLSHAGQILAPATRPWITDLAALCPYEGLQPGNLPEFERDPNWDNWALTDSPKDPTQAPELACVSTRRHPLSGG